MSSPAPRQRFTAFGVAIAVLVVTPLAVVASDRFTDVSDSNIFHDDIQWMAQADVTRGCNPPANDEFCPDDFVTREQMSAFMHRLARNRVVDAAIAQEAEHAATADEADHAATADQADHAATADEADHAATADQADHATTAGDADTLDGKDGADYVETGEADSVTSAMSVDEPGVSQAVSSSPTPLTATATSLISADIEVPATGYVVVHATWETSVDHVNGQEDIAQFDVSDTDGSFPDAGNVRNFIVPSGESTGTHAVVSATQRAFMVESPGTHTYHLVGAETLGSVEADNMVLTLLYVPTAYGTVQE